MPISGPIPESILTIAAAATVFTVMLTLGCGIVVGGFRWLWRHPGPIARGLFAVLIAVPALALIVTRAFDLPRAADIGIVLMAISPGAPVALRRSLEAGGHHSFAPGLQILVALLSVVSMPLSIVALDEVFIAQLLPLGLGMSIQRWLPVHAAWLRPKLARLASILIVVLAIFAIIDVWQVVVGAGLRIVLAIVAVTILALVVGHLMGGPDEATRTAVAISSAARNPGLALLVATLNHAPTEITATVLAYLVVSAFTIVPYAMLRSREPTQPQ